MKRKCGGRWGAARGLTLVSASITPLFSRYFLNSSFFDSAACKTENCRIRTLNSRRRRMPNDGHKELTIRNSSAKTADVNTCTGQTLAAFEQYMKRGQASRCCDETAMWLPPLRRCRRRGVVCFPAFAAGAVPMAAQAHAAVEGGEDAGGARFG